MAPRVAAAEPSVAGLVLLAGGAEPLQWAMVRQVRVVESCRLDPMVVQAKDDEPLTPRAVEGVGQHLVREAVERRVQLLVTTPTVRKLVRD